MSRKVSQLRLKLDNSLQTCNIREVDQIKEYFFDSLLLFKLEPYKFEEKCHYDSDSETEAASPVQRVTLPPKKNKRSSNDSGSPDTGRNMAPKKGRRDGDCDVRRGREPLPRKRKRRSNIGVEKLQAVGKQGSCLKMKFKRDGGKWVSTVTARDNTDASLRPSKKFRKT